MSKAVKHEIIPETIRVKEYMEDVQHHDQFGNTVDIRPTEMVRLTGLCRGCGKSVSAKMMKSQFTERSTTNYLRIKHNRELALKEKDVEPANEQEELTEDASHAG